MISERLARFIIRSRIEDLPASLRQASLRSIVNLVGTALAGAGDAGMRRMTAALLPFSGPADASLIGRSERADCLNAAFLNAAAGNVHDFDDTHPETIIHPSAPVAPALFALAERRPISGGALLHAFTLGAEIECRLGNAVSPGHYSHGWHITSTCGVFGAALACGRAIGLGEATLVAALGHASAQAAGLVETLGSMAKSVGVAQSARGGLLAALLAEGGVDGPAQPLEGERGFLKVTGMPARPEKLTEGLGEEWEIARNTFKPYPCGVVLNPVIDACLAMRARSDFGQRDIEAVTVSGHPLLRQRTDRPEPASGRAAQVSCQHAVAVSLIDGRAGLAEFSDARAAATDVRALGALVRVEEKAGLSVEGAEVEIRYRDGRLLTEQIKAARGSLARPLSDSEIEAKFRALAAFGSPKVKVEPLLEALWTLETAPDAGAIIRRAAAG